MDSAQRAEWEDKDMPTYHTDIVTTHGSRYLQQLCKHWSHKFTVEFDPMRGTIQLDTVRCTMNAEPDRLLVDVAGDDASGLPRMCEVVFDHIKRFAFRETLEAHWVEGARTPS